MVPSASKISVFLLLFVITLHIQYKTSKRSSQMKRWAKHIKLVSAVIQGVPKKIRLNFCLIFQQPSIEFFNLFLSWKLRSIRKFWIQNHFSAISGGRNIYKTKSGSETDQFIFVLSHSGLKTAKFAPSSANWPKVDTNNSQVAGHSNPNWLSRC